MKALLAPSQLHCSICPSRGDKVLALWHERAQQANCPSAAGRDLLVPGDPHHLLFSHSVVSDSLWPYGLQHVRLLCPPLSPEVCSNSCSLSQPISCAQWKLCTLALGGATLTGNASCVLSHNNAGRILHPDWSGRGHGTSCLCPPLPIHMLKF